jgi:hypothetical protein
MVSGLMHVCMNKIQNIGKNAWGGDSSDPVSLKALRDTLLNCSNINTTKIDFYGWLQFMDAVLRSLVMKAAMVELKITLAKELDLHTLTYDDFLALCAKLTGSFVMPSIDRLEAEGIKITEGHTESGHAVLLMHDLMMMREMCHAIKHGHPERVKRILKYWVPMFYGGGSYNYSNELMELLHNVEHDWPRESANVVFDSMIVNTTGEEVSCTEGDLRVEQLNDAIKEQAHGVNATPEYLEKITPAIGVIQHLTKHIYEDLGVEELNQHHAKVRQHKDIHILLDHLVEGKIFQFCEDKVSDHALVDLYRNGLQRLAGEDGGHARHLARHLATLRTRHGAVDLAMSATVRELHEAQDSIPAQFTIQEVEDTEFRGYENEVEAEEEELHDEVE